LSASRFALKTLFGTLEYACLLAANAGRGEERLETAPNAWDLLKAHRIATRLEDGDAVLDVGCGSGHTLHELSYFRAIRPLGVDLSLARRRHPEIPIQTFDGRRLPFDDGAFDVTLLGYVLHHLSTEHAEALIRECARVTKRRLLLLEDTLPEFDRAYRWRNHFHLREAGLTYGAESPRYVSPAETTTFRTHEGWNAFLASFPCVHSVSIESLASISRYVHHALIDVELVAP
jgi:SAM-dependent methyltransferase